MDFPYGNFIKRQKLLCKYKFHFTLTYFKKVGTFVPACASLFTILYFLAFLSQHLFSE